ncbi:MAG: dihydropteroate synthase [Leptospiraceae bacterium]|nr:dihydropteroate synthase [Leptospiraceae bacterium]
MPSKTELWGVINLTPDSFYAGSRFSPTEAIRQSEQFLTAGAAMIDVGAESTRPGAHAVPVDEQKTRLSSFVTEFRRVMGEGALTKISIDTRESAVMRHLADSGVRCFNDVSGGNAATYRVIAETGSTYVLTHTQGTPEHMQRDPHYEDVVREVTAFLREKTAELIATGVVRDKIIWDPGIGFGKTARHNLELIANMPTSEQSGHRLLMGVSRKSFIGKLLGKDNPADRLIGTLAVQMYLTLRRRAQSDAVGCDILRVHDVHEMAECLTVLSALVQHERKAIIGEA